MKARWFYFVSAAALFVSLAGCGKKPEEQPAVQPAAQAPTPIDLSTVGELTGSVKLDGAAPKPGVLKMAADPFCNSAHKTPVYAQDVVVGEKGALGNVIVYVKEGLGNRTFEVPKESVVLNQEGCMYSPHVIAIMAGQQFEVRNDDKTTHNIHPLPKDNREWNESQPPGAAPLIKTWARTETFPVKCNVHPWMKAYIAVFKHPYFAVTGKDGSFTIKNLPPGSYTIEAWQEKYGTTSQQVTIGPKETKSVNFVFKAQSGD
jgi:plastocyanin/predicted small lipoprotein YifL